MVSLRSQFNGVAQIEHVDWFCAWLWLAIYLAPLLHTRRLGHRNEARGGAYQVTTGNDQACSFGEKNPDGNRGAKRKTVRCVRPVHQREPQKWCRKKLYFRVTDPIGDFFLYYGIIPVTIWLTSVA